LTLSKERINISQEIEVKMKHTFYIVLFVAFILYGCSASEVTEEMGETQVEYKTAEVPQPPAEAKPTVPPVAPQETFKAQTQPEYIPQGPANPPPPPIKTTFTETKVEEVKTSPPPLAEEYQYKVQVFAFKSRLNAETEAQKIRNRLPDQKVYVEWHDNLFKVRLGIYSKWDHARSIKDALYNLGYTDSFVITENKQ
jgi:cell division septation protein DedD